ncbi:hypothetical protein E3P99_00777 [Wallemia hederae]|uniref:Fatty acid hydroxylase domain-containing protein n=1 Tax=Wallemia hederae TaxID=1540922 RepID=A0A4T0FWL7_9BASI|nr:hypothetical protein E3P99_00777 [Wallemia hederae]
MSNYTVNYLSELNAPNYSILPKTVSYPFYYTPSPQLFTALSDKTTSLLAPIVAYWAFSLFFHCLDQVSSLDKYRLHPPSELTSKNKVTVSQVIKAVLVQQVVQTALGIVALDDEDEFMSEKQHLRAMGTYSGYITLFINLALGPSLTSSVLSKYGAQITQFTYWWLIPALQFGWACFIMDTHQYFLHRLFHMNKFLYRHIHSVHHRLYVPYAFGALYNHPIEGFLLDTCGALLAHTASFMTTRQAIFLFVFSTYKTCYDHAGAQYPFDPFRYLFTNTSDYHDIHHQHFGLKYNFSQPFFVHWDDVFGTRLNRSDVKSKRVVEKKEDARMQQMPFATSGGKAADSVKRVKRACEVDSCSEEAFDDSVYCLAHRHAATPLQTHKKSTINSHQASKLDAIRARFGGSKPAAEKRRTKQPDTRLLAMKTRMNAKPLRDVLDTSQRVHVSVSFSAEVDVKQCSFFYFGKSLSMGRVLDLLADKLNVQSTFFHLYLLQTATNHTQKLNLSETAEQIPNLDCSHLFLVSKDKDKDKEEKGIDAAHR